MYTVLFVECFKYVITFAKEMFPNPLLCIVTEIFFYPSILWFDTRLYLERLLFTPVTCSDEVIHYMFCIVALFIMNGNLGYYSKEKLGCYSFADQQRVFSEYLINYVLEIKGGILSIWVTQ